MFEQRKHYTAECYVSRQQQFSLFLRERNILMPHVLTHNSRPISLSHHITPLRLLKQVDKKLNININIHAARAFQDLPSYEINESK